MQGRRVHVDTKAFQRHSSSLSTSVNVKARIFQSSGQTFFFFLYWTCLCVGCVAAHVCLHGGGPVEYDTACDWL